jgi:hypothetical protein
MKKLLKYSIKERMLVEVAKSIEIAYELCDLFTAFNVDMEVHADINTNPSLKAMKHCEKRWIYFRNGFCLQSKTRGICQQQLCQ